MKSDCPLSIIHNSVGVEDETEALHCQDNRNVSFPFSFFFRNTLRQYCRLKIFLPRIHNVCRQFHKFVSLRILSFATITKLIHYSTYTFNAYSLIVLGLLLFLARTGRLVHIICVVLW